MRKMGLMLALVPGLAAQSINSACDLNGDGTVNVADVQIAVNEALGLSTCTMNLDGTGACDVADVQRVITAALGGACVVTSQTPANITLPIEMIGPNGMTQALSVNIPSSANLSGQVQLSMQIHGLRNQTQASVQVNNSGWMPINSSTVTLAGLANAYGGIGGGFHTLTMTMNLPAGTVTSGTNQVSFKFNGTDGRVSGFRVLAFNVLDASGNALVPASTFVEDDPNTWTPPSTQASDISAGKSLFYSAALTTPTSSGSVAITAHCTNCHPEDGRDLKYFNYSNNSIIARSQFHGLSALQGAQIASYIRSLNVPNPGRPWNPPYQPGPGLDAAGIPNWSAGAGLSAVLDNDTEMINYLMPGGSTAIFSPNANLNARETPISLQLPDWNSWLPAFYPGDAWGTSTFTSSQVYTNYLYLRSVLQPNNATAFKNAAFYVDYWAAWAVDFLSPLTPAETSSSWTPKLGEEIYSTERWSLVKFWEMNQEFGLEAMAPAVFPHSDDRAWYTNIPFSVSPSILVIPSPFVGNGLDISQTYDSFAWYQLQMIVNAGNGRYANTYPYDAPYTEGKIQELARFNLDPTKVSVGPIMTLWLTKVLQESQWAAGPDKGYLTGWQPDANDASRLVDYGSLLWKNVPASTVTAIQQAYLSNWVAKISTFTPQQFYTGNWTTANATSASGFNPTVFDQSWPGAIAYMLPHYRVNGVSSSVLNAVTSWASGVWPSYNWTTALNAAPSGAEQ